MSVIEAWQQIADGVRGCRQGFLASTADLRAQQRGYLHALLRRQANTAFGRRHRFAVIEGPAAYRETVPLQEPQAVQQWVKRLEPAHPQVLSADTAFVEITGGSSGGAKYIPYGASGLEDFQRALHPWLDDLLEARPAISQGLAYWSISPVLGEWPTQFNGLPVGLGDDTQYFGERLAPHLLWTLAVPPEVGRLGEREAWQLETLLHLVRQPGLRLISVWSPSFLLALMEALPVHADALCSRLSGAEARRLRCALADGLLDTPVLWPELDTISCWTHGRAAALVPALRGLFPQARIQPKGLLATEGVVSLPLEEAADPVLAARSGFFEFEDERGDLRFAWELAVGRRYQVILSNHLGLYRYRLGDWVEMRGWHGSLPMLRFLGRGGTAVDLCGEKLDEVFASRALNGLEGFALLLPVTGAGTPRYLCISDRPEDGRVERRLWQNPQYAYARALGQLGPLQWRFAPEAGERYRQWCFEGGQRLGDIKPLALLPDDAFLRYLEQHP